MIRIRFSQSRKPDIRRRMLEDAIRLTLRSQNNPDVDLTLQLTGDEEMRQLNLTFRGIDKTTDVLAFDQEYIDPETDRLYLGDIVISIDQAQIQALENNHSLSEECALLAIHGTLHLLGFDHADTTDKDQMWAAQETILKELIQLHMENSG